MALMHLKWVFWGALVVVPGGHYPLTSTKSIHRPAPRTVVATFCGIPAGPFKIPTPTAKRRPLRVYAGLELIVAIFGCTLVFGLPLLGTMEAAPSLPSAVESPAISQRHSRRGIVRDSADSDHRDGINASHIAGRSASQTPGVRPQHRPFLWNQYVWRDDRRIDRRSLSHQGVRAVRNGAGGGCLELHCSRNRVDLRGDGCGGRRANSTTTPVAPPIRQGAGHGVCLL